MPAIETFDFFSPSNAHDFRRQLKHDLQGADWVRFLVCYYSQKGHETLKEELVPALQSEQSRGLVSLTCACGYKSLMALWTKVRTSSRAPDRKLKCFIPLLEDRKNQPALLHSKIVVIGRTDDSGKPKAILFTGSHNWTGRGLGTSRPHNAEASLRLETTWHPSWLNKIDKNEPLKELTGCQRAVYDSLTFINNYFASESAVDMASPYAEKQLELWMTDRCKNDTEAPKSEEVLVAIAVLHRRKDIAEYDVPREGDIICIHHYEKKDEKNTFLTGLPWIVFLWENDAALKKREQPWLVLGRVTSVASEGRGESSLGRFKWLLCDPAHNKARNWDEVTEKAIQSLEIRGGKLSEECLRRVQYWTLSAVSEGSSSKEEYEIAPTTEAGLEVVIVRAPNTTTTRSDKRFTSVPSWHGNELPLHGKRKREHKRKFIAYDENGISTKKVESMWEEQRRFFGFDEKDKSDFVSEIPHAELAGKIYDCDSPYNGLLFQREHYNSPTVPVLGGSHQETDVSQNFPDAQKKHKPGDRTPNTHRFRPTDRNPKKLISRLDTAFAPHRTHVEKALNLPDQKWEELIPKHEKKKNRR